MDERRQPLSRREPAAARRSPCAGGTWTSTPVGCRWGAAWAWSRPRAPASSSSRDRRTGQARVVKIDADTVAALRVYRATRGSVTHELVRDSAPVLSNLDGTHATLLLADGVPVKVVSERLGHASATITPASTPTSCPACGPKPRPSSAP